MIRIAVLASGSGTNLQSIIDSIESGSLQADIKVVLSDVPGAGALERAKKHGYATETVTKADYPVREDFDRAAVEILKGYDVDLIVLAGFMRIISDVFLDAFPMRIINIHPSLLPSFPGLDVQKKALNHGVKFSGATVHFVDKGLDSGPIIIQAVVPVKGDDTAETLSARILKEEHRIYPRAIELIGEGRLTVVGRRVICTDDSFEGATLINPPEDKD